MALSAAQHTKRVYLLAILGLFVFTLAAFAVVWPFNSSGWDDWLYLYFGQQGVWGVSNANRPYVFGEAVLADWIMPGRPQAIHILNIACFWGTSLGLFHLLNRLNPGHGWFAFLTAAAYLLYVPFNGSQARPMQSAVYSWTVFLVMAGIILLLEQIYLNEWRRWVVVLAACLVGYLACRSYESAIPLLLAAPGLVWWAARRLSWRLIISAGLWWAVLGVGVLQFAIPYLNQEPVVTYQEQARLEKLELSTLWSATQQFFGNAFPADRFVHLEYNFWVPALILAGVLGLFNWLFWRRHPGQSCLPSLRQLGMMWVIGMIWVELGGSVYTLTTYLYQAERAHFFAAPGEALVVTSVLGFAAWAAQRTLHIPARPVLTGLAAVLCLMAAHWYYRADLEIYTDPNNLFDHKNHLLRDVVALAPALADGTALIYYCDEPAQSYQKWRAPDVFAGSYLYLDSRGILFSAGEIAPGSYHSVQFDGQGVSPQSIDSTFVFVPPQSHYRYDELIVLACQEDGGLRILDRFPPELAPAGAALDTYNPYARILRDFIPPERARVLAR